MTYRVTLRISTALFLLSAVAGNVLADEFDPELHEQVLPMSPEESLKTMFLQDGYSMEIVAAEPLIEEPVTFAFDGNGRIYVAEMLTYMQDADSTGTFKSVSRIKRLEDNDGDGVFESFSIFADKLLLPRMISTLDDGRILVRETNTLDLLLLTDTDGDGVADKRETIFEGGDRGGNLEHQPSGLIYGLDNWLYVTYTDKRYKFVDNKVISSDVNSSGGQWGLAQDKAGRIYFSAAGGENPVFGFQAPVIYNPASYVPISVEGEQAPGFREVFPISTTPDVQGGLPRLRDDNTLNHFTGGGGQSIYLGGLYDDMEGDYIIAEPVGNLIRRSKVLRRDGHSVISNPYQSESKEFVVSSDPNFRPLWTDTAPDGSLMVLDMYRGIIQEGNWTREGSYLRGVIDKYGFDKNIGRGRLYRIKKDGVTLYSLPRMFEESGEQLISHLRHKNRWWRLEAQKLMVLSGDPSLIPALQELARSDSNPDARVHALWTLEGLGNRDKELLTGLFTADERELRNAAVRISEQLVTDGDKDIAGRWLELASDQDIEVAQQVLLSAWYVRSDNRRQILQAVKQAYPNKKGIMAIEEAIERFEFEDEKQRLLASGDADFAVAMTAGENAYKSLCASCHGDDGKGAPSAGSLIAPSLHDNARVTGNTTLLTNLVLNGMQGPIDDVSYVGGMMPSIASNGDEFVANVLTYIRNGFGNNASMIPAKDVTTIKAMYPDRASMWTQESLQHQFAQNLGDKNLWKVTTNFTQHPRMTSENLTDGLDHNDDNGHWFGSRGSRTNGDAITLELPAAAFITEVILSGRGDNSSRSYLIEFSLDGEQWQVVADNNFDKSYLKAQTFGHKTRFIRITNREEGGRWLISEVDLIGRADSAALSALIIDGQNNHQVWPKSTVMMKRYLEETGLFEVDVYRSKPTWRGEQHPEYYQMFSDDSQFHVESPQPDPDFAPVFADYDVVISNFGYPAASWPAATQQSFEQYMKSGGGFVSVHAANNSFPDWLEYNKMTGVGGWGDRSEKDGPHLYYDDAGELVRDDQPGRAGNHGNKHELQISKRSEHPILSGLPDIWMHTADECYRELRGPAERLQILATALCLKEENGNGLNEPALMTVEYGDGRIFHTTLGHDTVSLNSVGFITTFQRGTEWAATGGVSQHVPADFPNASKSSSRDFDQSRPNILFIMVDDLRPQFAAYGRTGMVTPALDQLANEGVVFKRAYVNVPVCGASRASLMTGLRPKFSRFVNFLARADEDAPDVPTLPAHLKTAGYTTVSLGKVFHAEDDSTTAWSRPPWRPNQSASVSAATSPRNYLEAINIEADKDEDSKRGAPFERVEVPDDAYFDGMIAEQAITELDVLSKNDAPFFLAVGFLKPHLPFNAPAKYWDMYDPADISLAAFKQMPARAPTEANHNFGELRNYRGIPEAPEPVSEDMARKLRHGYYAATSYVDAQIGKVLQALNDLSLADNTIVVLMGDHGWSLGEHGLWCKHSPFDVATHTPLIIKAPDTAPGETNGLVEFIDIYPTLMAMTGTPPPDHLQGSSMLGMLEDPASPGKTAVFPRWKKSENVRTDRYSYTEFRTEDGELISHMLYDSVNDPDETVNLADQSEYAADVSRLQALIAENIAHRGGW